MRLAWLCHRDASRECGMLRAAGCQHLNTASDTDYGFALYPKGAGINAGHAFGALPCCHPMSVHAVCSSLLAWRANHGILHSTLPFGSAAMPLSHQTTLLGLSVARASPMLKRVVCLLYIIRRHPPRSRVLFKAGLMLCITLANLGEAGARPHHYGSSTALVIQPIPPQTHRGRTFWRREVTVLRM